MEYCNVPECPKQGMYTDVLRRLLSLFTARHFNPHYKKETTKNKSQIAKCKILD